MYYVYLLRSLDSDDTYVGFSSDLRRRFQEHQQGKNHSTRLHKWRLAYYEAYQSEDDARRRERAFKQHGNALAHLKKRASESIKNPKSAG